MRRGWLDDEMISFFQKQMFALLGSPCGGLDFQDLLVGIHQGFNRCRRQLAGDPEPCIHLLPSGAFGKQQETFCGRQFEANHWVCTVYRAGNVELLDSLSS